MPGKAAAPRQGEVLKERVVELAEKLGLKAETEVRAARRLWVQNAESMLRSGMRKHAGFLESNASTKESAEVLRRKSPLLWRTSSIGLYRGLW